MPFFPLGGFTPLQSSTLTEVAARLGATPLQTALAWLLHRAPNILLIPGTSSVAHLRENLAAAELTLPKARAGPSSTASAAPRFNKDRARTLASACRDPIQRATAGAGRGADADNGHRRRR